MKKIVSLLLVILMLTSLLMACQKQEEESSDPTTVVPQTSINEVEEDEKGIPKDRIPEGEALEALGFAGSTVKVLSWEEEEAQNFPKEDSAEDPIKSKLYNHWLAIEERLSIDLDPTWCTMHTNNYNTFLTVARSDDANYDLIQTQSLFPSSLATEGYLCNLRNNLKFPDLEKNSEGEMMPWWPESVDAWTHNDSLFFIVSNSSAMGISNMAVIFINDGMITSKGASSPVESVIRGLWTVEEMNNVSKLFAGAAESATPESRYYGFAVDHFSRLDPLYYSMGFDSIVKNSSGVAEFGYDETNELEAITKAIAKLEPLITGVETIVNDDANLDDPSLMNEGRCAMLLGFMQYIRQLEKTEEYTVVPLPMLDTKQSDPTSAGKGYRTTHRDWMDVWCIPTTTSNKVLSGIVLEANASSEYRLIAPFYYEQYLKDRYANGDSGRQCFDILRASVIYDFGRAMFWSDIGAETFWRPCFRNSGKTSFANVFESNFKASSDDRVLSLQELLDAYEQYKNN